MTVTTFGELGEDKQLNLIYYTAGLTIATFSYLTKPEVEKALKEKTTYNKLAAYFWSAASGALAGYIFKIIRTGCVEGQSGAVTGAVMGLIGGVVSEFAPVGTVCNGVKTLIKWFLGQ